jgi:rare lipoprotein A
VRGGQGIVFSSPMRSAGATWYGPGLYGNHTACGQTLRPGTVGVAHKTLPCGTTIKLAYHGRSLVTRVIDRGPYTAGNAFDLTNGARRALDFEGVDRVRYAVALGDGGHRD